MAATFLAQTGKSPQQKFRISRNTHRLTFQIHEWGSCSRQRSYGMSVPPDTNFNRHRFINCANCGRPTWHDYICSGWPRNGHGR